MEDLVPLEGAVAREPLPDSEAFSSPFATTQSEVKNQQLAVFAAQLKVGLQLDGKAMTIDNAVIHTLPFQLGLGEIVIQGCFNHWFVC